MTEALGVYAKLKNPKLPWDTKIGIANDAWTSKECVIPNKQQVLLDWVCQQLLDISKREKSTTAIHAQGLWDLLKSIFQTLNAVEGKEYVHWTVMPHLLQIFTEEFSNVSKRSTCFILNVVQCGHMVLSNSVLNTALIAKFENYVLFSSSLLGAFQTIFYDVDLRVHDLHKAIFSLLEISLNLYIPLQRRQTNHRKLFERTCENLIGPVFCVCYTLKNLDKSVSCDFAQERINTMTHLLHQLLSDSFFRKEHLAEYPSALTTLKDKHYQQHDVQEPKTKRTKLGNYTSRLFETLRKLCSIDEDSNLRCAAMEIIPQLFMEFLKARRSNQYFSSSVEFEFFTEMCNLLEIDFGEAHYAGLSSKLGLVYRLLQTILDLDVYQIAEDNANNGIQLKWFLELTKHLLEIPTSCQVFQCLEALLKLNHYIIEPHLSSVLQHCWNNATCNEKDTVFSCDSLLSLLVKTYTKLRQFDKFTHQMLASLTALENVHGKWNGFTALLNNELIQASQALPCGLASSIWKIFNQAIVNEFVPGLHQLAGDKQMPEEQMLRVACSFERAVGLFRVFLLNTTFGGITQQHRVPSTDSTLTAVFKASVADVLGTILDVIPRIKDKKCSESVCASAFVLFHALQEVHNFLRRFGYLWGCVGDQDALSVHWDEHIQCHIQRDMKKYKDRTTCDRQKYLLVLLCIQRLRVHLTRSSSGQTTDKLIDFIFRFTDSLSTHLSLNMEVWSVDQSSFSLAYWHSLCTNASLLLPACSYKHRLQFARCLIQTLLDTSLPDADQPSVDDKNTVQSISKTLLQSADFHMLPSMQECCMKTLWCQMGPMFSLQSTDHPHDKLVEVITALGSLDPQGDPDSVVVHEDDETMLTDQEDTDSEDSSSADEEADEIPRKIQKTEKPLPSTVAALLPLGNIFDAALLELQTCQQSSAHDCGRAKDIAQLLSLLCYLPLDWLTDFNHVGCVLGLLASDVLTTSGPSQDANKTEYLMVSFLGRRLLTVILNGCISKKRFLIEHVVDMNFILSWALPHFMTLRPLKGDGDFDKLESVSIDLLCALTRYILKIASSSSPMDGFVHKLCEYLGVLENELHSTARASMVEVIRRNQPLLNISTGVMTVLEKVIACKTSRLNEVKMAASIAAVLSPPMLDVLHVITTVSGAAVRDADVDLVLRDSPVFVDCYSAVLHIYSISQTSRKLSRSKEVFGQQWQWRRIFSVILSFAVNTLDHPEDIHPELKTARTKSCLHFLDIACLLLVPLELDLPEDFHARLLASMLNFISQMAAAKGSKGCGLTGGAVGVVLALLQGASSDILLRLLNGLCYDLSPSRDNSVHRIGACLGVWSSILSAKLTKLRKKELRAVLPQVLMVLQSVLQQHTRTHPSLCVLAMEVMAKILSLGTSMVSPHNASVTFHGSLLVSLDHNDETFPLLFHAQYLLLSTVLFHQTEAVYKTVHVFVTCLKNMLKGLCYYCAADRNPNTKQEKSKPEKNNQDNPLNCAQTLARLVQQTNQPTNQDNPLNCTQTLARLYQEIATHKTVFPKYVPYMIAEYIHQTQLVSLQTKIKECLLPGVYCLMDLCGEHEMALLYAVLDKGSRELFRSLAEDFNKFHKFKGKV